ncbi:lasso peptide biosynthesis B2 protein [Jiulongibacter sediminis]|uniref:Microcin J25-processing protein McjB C-terminal domain-containing protein n=1 Tax=Jiulongibacter sediminis TaxID=1605367 RepID=A0A0P7C7D4_9BACT|nr:lasso peptide biosynthesis B2 protein [Jiulongibacter sediminis]KPM49424.1 hypothetical protein AFM12_02065 [Jiulongibacter sediminis]TBX26472.1 hypothetical protein TK44_02070 [Jiulongibacter sediminis]
MNNWLKKYNKLGIRERQTLKKAILQLIWVYLNLRFRSFENFKKWFKNSLKDESIQDDELLSASISKASIIYPGMFTCLPQALAFKKMKGKASEYKLVIGVQPGVAKLDAHAWIEKKGEVLIGDVPDFNYLPLWTWE